MRKMIVRAVAVLTMAVVLTGCAGIETIEGQNAAQNNEPELTTDATAAADDTAVAEATETPEAEKTTDAKETAEPAEDTEPPESAEEVAEEASGGGSILCFSGKDVYGNEVNTADVFAKNKITVVNIWASWCPPCAREIPELDKLNKELNGKGCAVVGLLDDGEDPRVLEDAKYILEDAQATYLNMIFPEQISVEVEFEVYPTTFFVDHNGTILGDPVVGARPDQYKKTVEKLLSNM